MKLWKISQNQNTGYDTYCSAVVAAKTEDAARKIHPSRYNDWGDSSWVEWPHQVMVEYLGEAKPETKKGVIVASYNAS